MQIVQTKTIFAKLKYVKLLKFHVKQNYEENKHLLKTFLETFLQPAITLKVN